MFKDKLAFLLILLLNQPALPMTFYSSNAGNDANSCEQAKSVSTPKLTIAGLNGGISCLSSGDTLQIVTGTYVEHISPGTIPSGLSWGTATTIKSVTGEPDVTIKPGAAYYQAIDLGNGSSDSYIIFQGLILDGSDAQLSDACGLRIQWPGAHHIRFTYGETRYWAGQGVGFWCNTCDGTTVGGNEFTHSTSHSNGISSTMDHGIYISTPDSVVEHSEFFNNAAYGIQLYGSVNIVNNARIDSNKIYDNGGVGPSGGILASSGTGQLISNNLIYNNSYEGIDTKWGGNTSGLKLFNNTLVSNGNYGIIVSAKASGAEVRNNIAWNNSAGGISNSGVGTSISNNLCNTGCTFSGDPLFKDEASYDYYLTYSSPAKDTGITLVDVPDDIDGTSRPRGSAYDIGSYEFIVPTSPTLMLLGFGY